MTLPNIFPSAKKPNQPDSPMHDLQLTMLSIANYLNGNGDDLSNYKTEREGGLYVKDRVQQYLAKQRLLKTNL